MIKNRAYSLMAIAAVFISCDQQGSNPVTLPEIPCEDANALVLPRFSISKHVAVETVVGKDTAFAATQWASGDSVRSFFGNKEIKVVFTLNRSMFLLTYPAGGEAVLTRISHDDEGLNGAVGSINSPLFSPDGKKIVFAGTTRGKPGFILDAVAGGVPALRVPLEHSSRSHVTADPHWYIEDGKTYIYFATQPGLVNYSSHCGAITGYTYRMQMLGDTLLDSMRITGIPGSYRGGISKDGEWAGTSYASSALFQKSTGITTLLAGGVQQCNPSMNPFPIGSKNMDYMMILAFGGEPAYKMVDGTEIIEGQHENFWIYNKDNVVVWQAKRPDEKIYLRFDKPEWSTHPNYASAVCLRKDNGDGDLYIVKVGDLANTDDKVLHQSQGYLKIGQGGFTSDSYSHLWVAP